MKQFDLTNKRIGSLIAVKYTNGHWECKCDCGNTKSVRTNSLLSGNTSSCGCLQYAQASYRQITHGLSKSTEYKTWVQMKGRCYNPNSTGYKKYGGAGIQVCERWTNSFSSFLKDMGSKPTPIHSLDRYPNGKGNYEPSNCRWATPLEQVKNRSYTKWVEYNGEIMTIADFKRRIGVNSQQIRRLLETMSTKDIFEKYKNKKHAENIF